MTKFLSVLCFLCALVVPAFAQMPDPKQMAGIPRPVNDLPDGSISVRLIRGQLSNNIASHVSFVFMVSLRSRRPGTEYEVSFPLGRPRRSPRSSAVTIGRAAHTMR